MSSRSLPVLSAEVYAKFNACVHCGLCLPACPTYVETMDEADSPRGRIHLMKAVVDGKLAVGAGEGGTVFEHLDRCLVCRACETACPSGVQYHDLIEAVRPQVAEAVLGKGRGMRSGTLQWVVKHVLPKAGRARLAMKPLGLMKTLGLGGMVERMAPGAMAVAEGMKSESGDESAKLAMFTPARAGVTHRGSVVLLRGCVGSVVSGGVNAACLRVLTENGFDVHLLEGDGGEPCCGAMAAHANDPEGAREHARRMVAALERKSVTWEKASGGGSRAGADYFVSPIAGCGAQLKSLHHVLEGDREFAARAKAVVQKMRDITEMLMAVGLRPPRGQIERRVTYHDPCHLAHAQRITSAPRQILALIPGLILEKLAESDMCCGAAGTYSMNQPEMAAKLGQRKAEKILATGVEELITANVGCALQIARHLRERGAKIRVKHVVEILAEAYDKE